VASIPQDRIKKNWHFLLVKITGWRHHCDRFQKFGEQHSNRQQNCEEIQGNAKSSSHKDMAACTSTFLGTLILNMTSECGSETFLYIISNDKILL